MYSSGLGAPSRPPSSGGSSAKTLKLRTSVMLRAMLSPWVLILAVYTVVLLEDDWARGVPPVGMPPELFGTNERRREIPHETVTGIFEEDGLPPHCRWYRMTF